MPNKKGAKKSAKGGAVSPTLIQPVVNSVISGLNTTKKNFPVLKKIPGADKKSYVSPYSIKAIHKN
jgi:hypothetical protein